MGGGGSRIEQRNAFGGRHGPDRGSGGDGVRARAQGHPIGLRVFGAMASLCNLSSRWRKK